MAPRLSGQTSLFDVVFFVSKSLLGIERQQKFKKFTILTRKPAKPLCYATGCGKSLIELRFWFLRVFVAVIQTSQAILVIFVFVNSPLNVKTFCLQQG